MRDAGLRHLCGSVCGALWGKCGLGYVVDMEDGNVAACWKWRMKDNRGRVCQMKNAGLV